MQLLRSPGAYSAWQNGPWQDADSTVVPVQERRARNPYLPIRGRDGQRMPYKAHFLSANYCTPQLGLNMPTAAQLLPVQRYLKSNVAHRKPLFVKGYEATVPTYTWSGLNAFERTVANQ